MATGKISRLPREIREQVNQRLNAGEAGKRLVAWLNELPAVRAVMAEEFDGAAINEQNLTNWKQGGFREWRMEREARDFMRPSPETTTTTVTTKELATGVAIRHLLLVHEWQQSPMPVERRWRQMRVILRDTLKLQRQDHSDRRLELDWERLRFAEEKFEDAKHSDTRRAMVGFLVAARKWPEVGEAMETAFRLFQERKVAEAEGNKAELKPIKVNQGGKKFQEEAQTGFVGCSPSPVSSPPGRGDDLARFWVQESATTSATVGGARGNVIKT